MSPKRPKPAKRTSKPGQPLDDALRALVAGLNAAGRPSMIIGGIAVIARGVMRLTRDIDATIAGGGTDLEALLAVLQQQGIVPRIEDAVRFAERTHVLLLRHGPSGIDVDLSLAWLPFELDAIAASDVLSIHGARVPVARAEDLVIYKIAAWRPQDQQDVERLVALHGEGMNLERVRAFARDLAAMLEDSHRVEEVEKVLTRSLIRREVTPASVQPTRRTPPRK